MMIGDLMEEGQELDKKGRFAIRTPDGDAELLYEVVGSSMNLFDIFVPEKERGKGYGERLVKAAAAYSKEHNLTLRPDSPQIERLMQVHPELFA